MIRTLLVFLGIIATAALLWTASAIAQSSSATVGQTQNQVTIQNLPPASSCFICDCNSQDFSCRTSCQSITNFAARQQCEAACGKQQATCLSNAQKLQRAVDDQRALTQQNTASGRTN